MTKKLLLAALVGLLSLPSAAMAFGNNNPPPGDALYDLAGQPVPHGAAQPYSVDFTAAYANTAITFAFREDPAFISFSGASVTDVTTGSTLNLLTNGDFSLGSGSNATGWTYANIYGAYAGGEVSSSCGGGLATCWYDGAVQAYDAISQTVMTNVGDTYQISFEVSDNSGLTTFQDLSNNGDTTGTGGNGIDVVTYALAGLPPAGTAAPEASTWAMLVFGFAGIGLVGYRQRRAAKMA